MKKSLYIHCTYLIWISMANKVIGFIFMDIIRRWEIPLFDFILSNQNNSLNYTAEIVPTLLKISTRRQTLCLGAEWEEQFGAQLFINHNNYIFLKHFLNGC